MHSKTKEKKVKLQLLFQPSCFGNSIFCQTPNCTTIRDALSKNNETISVSNSTGNAPAPVNGTGKRFLSGEAVAKGDNKTTGNSTNGNSTKANETKIDYKGLNEEAFKKLPHTIPKGIRFLNVTGRFGNVYINVI